MRIAKKYLRAYNPAQPPKVRLASVAASARRSQLLTPGYFLPRRRHQNYKLFCVDLGISIFGSRKIMGELRKLMGIAHEYARSYKVSEI
ncbi:hypothetical protein PVV74_07870 [Roseovarius sp. SK2]|uniref:hypothetical protein n=1 Tax=Roseovarius TaxID=74030 RepID=UPI00237A8F75|nr:hypothetical protein [Roseovarius sp. SK2]MDD9725367.1 hypothetical protein [Roseovarius sp. SK2]